ncbi:MAG: YtxH domain-containing protein [Porphyromonas sp.]|nr:YtxH domain-containing protein [Porphyromonas sp.]
MACNNNSGKFLLGILIGAAAGAAAAYFSDRSRRERFVDEVGSRVDRARDSLVEGYYEAKERYNEYRNRVSNTTSQMLSDVQQELDDLD